MRLSRERLLQEAGATGFLPDSLEKVIRLIGLLNGIFSQPYLRERLVLSRVVSATVTVADPDRRWAVFVDLISSPRLPRALGL